MQTDWEWSGLVIDNWALSLSFMATKEVMDILWVKQYKCTIVPSWQMLRFRAGQELTHTVGNLSTDQQVLGRIVIHERLCSFDFIPWSHLEFLKLIDVSIQTVQNAVTMLCGTEQLIGSLPEVKWAQQVRSLATELQEESLRVIIQHLPRVIRTQAFQDLRRVRLCCRLLWCILLQH